jgi:aryl-alcohol dehydrogenase-like predicted oxidoreductase
MIPKQAFGRTGHISTRAIFGSYALSNATQKEADQVLNLLLKYGINHIDTARSYGNAEKRIGPWMEHHRKDFFLATKSGRRTYNAAWADLQRSLNELRVDYVDLWQMHALANPQGWAKAMGEGGALEAFIEARQKGLVRFLGVTGHGSKIAGMHRRSLERFDFDTVLLPYNYLQMQNPRYAADFIALLETCQQRNVAVQTIKSVARRPWGDLPKTHNTYFYQPLEDQPAIDSAVHWVLGNTQCFLITAGDMTILPRVLDATSRFEQRPSDQEMSILVAEYGMESIFSY